MNMKHTGKSKKKKMSRRKAKPLLFTFILLFLFATTIRYFSGETHRLQNPISSIRLHHRHLVIFETSQNPHLPPPPPLAAVLLPDWELLLLLPSTTPHHSLPPLSCVFHNGETSSATFSGVLPWTHRRTYTCSVPTSLRRQRVDIPAPLLVGSRAPVEYWRDQGQILRWNSLVYESFSTPVDVVVFAKGVNNRQTSNRRPSDLHCVFRSGNAIVATAVTSSSQEVFRCRHPDMSRLEAENVTVSLEVVGGMSIPSVAQYRPPPAQDGEVIRKKSLICACTMVHNVAKFLAEWVMYHSAVGVDEFFLYDNGSVDDLDGVVEGLGLEVTRYLWPWAKTQEAGFSHCAVAHMDTCKWMLFLDVDEFAFAPGWGSSKTPSSDMISSLLPGDEEKVGQVMVYCQDYGPSGQKEHPRGGVTQGYTCRRRLEERHKSIVRLDAVDESLTNVVHHFKVKDGYEVRKMSSSEALVNHYKFQAWPEFRTKFRRRVSAYVVDWTQAINLESKDRTPGLGFEAVEPKDWAGSFCDVKDTRLRDVALRWFERVGGSDGDHKLAWENR